MGKISSKNFKKPLFWLVALPIVALLAIIGFGLASLAAGYEDRQPQYLQAHSALDPDNKNDGISFVVIPHEYYTVASRNYRDACSAQAFIDHADSVVFSDQADWDHYVDTSTVQSVCFRFESPQNANRYLYKEYALYGMGASTLAYQEIYDLPPVSDTVKPGGNMTKLWISAGIPWPEPGEDFPTIEYVPLSLYGQNCDGSAFTGTSDRRPIFSAESDTEIDLVPFGLAAYSLAHYNNNPGWSPPVAEYPAIALCFRTRVDVDYTYLKYGDSQSNIFFEGGWIWDAYDASEDPFEHDAYAEDLNVFAPNARRLDWAVLELGEECSAAAFNPADGGLLFSHFSGSDSQEVRVGQSMSVRLTPAELGLFGTCFRADYGHGNVIYKAYERFSSFIRIEVVWKFALSTYQFDREIGVSSGREISRWRAVRSDSWSNYYTPCSAATFSGVSSDSMKSGTTQEQEEFRSSRIISIRGLDSGDVGRLYCIEVTDRRGDKGYVLSDIITPFSPLFSYFSYWHDDDSHLNVIAGGGDTDGTLGWEVIVEEDDVILPENWDQLSAAEKIALNPYGCVQALAIRADNGRCLVDNHQMCDFDDPQSTKLAFSDDSSFDLRYADGGRKYGDGGVIRIPIDRVTVPDGSIICVRVTNHHGDGSTETYETSFVLDYSIFYGVEEIEETEEIEEIEETEPEPITPTSTG